MLRYSGFEATQRQRGQAPMGPFEYLLLFAAVILGLAVSDLAISLHRLMSAGGKVRWDVLAPLAALVAFLKIVSQWWSWFNAEPLAKGLTFEMYLLVLVEAVLLFLLAATALPDEVPEKGLDLREYFAHTCRRYWALFLLQVSLWMAVSIWIQVGIGGARLSLLQPVYLVLPLCVIMLLIKNRIVNGIVLGGFTILYVVQNFGLTLAR